MSSYEFDREALDEIEYWQAQAAMWQEKAENLYGHLTNLIELNDLQADLHVIDMQIKEIKKELDS